jgi:hypothetical protein
MTCNDDRAMTGVVPALVDMNERRTMTGMTCERNGPVCESSESSESWSHILHSPTTEEDASGLRTIRLESTNVNAFDSVGIEADSKGSVDVDREDFVGTVPSSVEFVGRKDLE